MAGAKAIVCCLLLVPLGTIVAFTNTGSCNRRKSRVVLVPLRATGIADNDNSPPPNTSNSWRSAVSTIPDGVSAVKELCSACAPRPDVTKGENGLAFLFVSSRHSDSFPDIVKTAYESLGPDTTLLSAVGGGVVGGGTEIDDPTAHAVSMLAGNLPPTASLEVFKFGGDEQPPPADSEAWAALRRSGSASSSSSDSGEETIPSYVLFADPWSPIQAVLDGLDGSGDRAGGAVVAGGITCPTFGDGDSDQPTVAINAKAYPRGSAVGLGLSGSVGLQAIVAQGCRSIGPAFGVTQAEENRIVELDGKPAMEQLQKLAEEASGADKASVERSGFLVGLAAPGSSNPESGDYLVRQIIGVEPPALMVGDTVKRGDVLRFHVRDADAARGDLRNMVRRARTERMFAGPGRAGKQLAAVQVSCVARGRSLFGADSPDVDLDHVGQLLGQRRMADRSERGADEGGDSSEDVVPVAGFFANGEIGPVGIAGVGLVGKSTHMHGFTTVAAMLCEFGGGEEDSSPSSSGSDATEHSSAWG